MKCFLSRSNRVGVTGAAVIVLMGGCLHGPIVVNGATCMIVWDRVDAVWVKEYQVTLSPNVQAGVSTKEIRRMSSQTTSPETVHRDAD